MRKRLLATAIATAVALGTVPNTARADNTKLAVIVFPGIPNLPIFAAQSQGFFAKRGLDVDLKFTPNSEELRNGLAEGRYQIAHSAIDNAFAMKDKANVDIAVVKAKAGL
ncbi:MAG: ABC transporter substrate-binding protein [Xanthobacteraceae bacterium]|nr:ABC transporter substrate-binding protein [Xanthobacteraceae bacterium]